MLDYHPDLLGAGYEAARIDLPNDDEGPVNATLVRRRADTPTPRAVLYVHGYTDYFFQRHLAEFHTGQGWDFYALDLRKYGRSLHDFQTPNYCSSLADYLPELTAALHAVRTQEEHDTVMLAGHSTGGLLTALWAHRLRGRGLIDGVWLNSPFVDQNLPAGMRAALEPLVAAQARLTPKAQVPLRRRDGYGHSIHRDARGEWDFRLDWKPHGGFPVHYGWLAAVLRGQRVLRRGLDIDVPVLVLHAAHSRPPEPFTEEVRSADTVLNVAHMARHAARLGRDVERVAVEGGLHDLVLSAPEVRAEVFAHVREWTDRKLTDGAPDPGARESA